MISLYNNLHNISICEKKKITNKKISKKQFKLQFIVQSNKEI